MKKLLLSIIVASVVLAAFMIFDINQRSSASASALPSVIQKGGGLSLSQIEALIKNGTPDSIIASEIKDRGISSPLNANALARLKRLGAGPKTIQAILNRGAKAPKKPQPQADSSPDKFIILVADFDGPNPQNYRVTEKIIQQLSVATREYPDISVEALRQPIIEQQGSKAARAIGAERKASIVLWGWYGPTPEAVEISAHFEALRAPKGLHLRQNLETQTSPISELNGFKIQTRLSGKMTYLTLLTIGIARYESGDYDGAIKRFTTALSQSDVPDQMIDPADIYFYRGNAHSYKADANEMDQAIADYDEAIKIRPDFATAYYNRGIAYAKKGQYGLAIADYDKAIEIKLDFAGAYNNRGYTYFSKGEYDLAIADFDKAIKIKPDYATAYNNRGNAYDEKGQHDRAIADYDKAIKIKPDFAVAYYNRGLTYRRKGEYDLAIADYGKAIKIKPDYAMAYNNRGIAYSEKGQPDRAIADYDKAIKIKPDDADVYYNRGNAYFSKGEYDLAIADYDKAIKIKPDDADVYYNRGYTYFSKGEYDLAIADFDKAIKFKTDDADAYYNRGLTYRRKGEYDLAIADYDKAIKIKPDDADVYYNRALAYQDKGERDRAIADFKSVLRLTNDPNIRQLAEQQLQKLGVK